MKNLFLNIAGVVFGIVAILHLVRFLMKWPVMIGSVTVPLGISPWAFGVSLILSLGCFLARGRRG